MTYQEFVDKYKDKGIDFDGYYGYQCMDLAHQYAVEVVGHDFAPAPAAKDVWDQNINGYDKISNTPDGVPTKGDIIVWGTAIGPFGHIAVFDHGDANTFTSFDQNWPINSVCHFQNHNYTGVLGWFHPQSSTPPPDLQTQLDEANKLKDLYYNNWQTAQHSFSEAMDKLNTVKGIVYGKGWPWTKINNLKKVV